VNITPADPKKEMLMSSKAHQCDLKISSNLLAFWRSSGGVLEEFWRSSGGVLEEFWRSSGGVLEEFWRSSGGVLRN
jgi:hypothetical protein